MDAEHGQGQLQRPVYDEEHQQGIGSVNGQGGEEKTKKPMLKKVKDKVRKIKHTMGKKSKNHDDKQGDDNLASPDNVESLDHEEEEGYEEDDEEQEVDPEDHGVDDQGIRKQDEKVDANPSLTQSFERMAMSEQPENEERRKQGEKNQFSTEPMQEDQQKSFDSAGSQEDATSRELPTQEHNPGDQKNQSYTTKISAAAAGLASTVYGKAANAGTLLKEKVAKPSGSPTGQQQTGQQLSDQSGTDQAQQQPGYAQKVYAAIQPAKDRAAALASTAYEKAAGAGAAATEATKTRAAGASDVAKAKAAVAQERAGQTAAGAKSTISEKLKPGEEEKALSQVIADMISSRKDTAKDTAKVKAGEARDIGAEKAAHAKEKAYEARGMGAEKAKEQTAIAKEKANELKGKTAEAKDVGTEKAKEKADHAREGTDNSGTPMVEKIKGAVTSLFGTRASADGQAQAATEQQSTQVATEEKQMQEQSA